MNQGSYPVLDKLQTFIDETARFTEESRNNQINRAAYAFAAENGYRATCRAIQEHYEEQMAEIIARRAARGESTIQQITPPCPEELDAMRAGLDLEAKKIQEERARVDKHKNETEKKKTTFFRESLASVILAFKSDGQTRTETEQDLIAFVQSFPEVVAFEALKGNKEEDAQDILAGLARGIILELHKIADSYNAAESTFEKNDVLDRFIAEQKRANRRALTAADIESRRPEGRVIGPVAPFTEIIPPPRMRYTGAIELTAQQINALREQIKATETAAVRTVIAEATDGEIDTLVAEFDTIQQPSGDEPLPSEMPEMHVAGGIISLDSLSNEVSSLFASFLDTPTPQAEPDVEIEEVDGDGTDEIPSMFGVVTVDDDELQGVIGADGTIVGTPPPLPGRKKKMQQ